MSAKMKGPPVTVTIHVEHVTDKAVLIDRLREVWLPKSQIRGETDFVAGEQYDVEIPDWLAKKSGLID